MVAIEKWSYPFHILLERNGQLKALSIGYRPGCVCQARLRVSTHIHIHKHNTLRMNNIYVRRNQTRDVDCNPRNARPNYQRVVSLQEINIQATSTLLLLVSGTGLSPSGGGPARGPQGPRLD